jgi:hypothetical protein
MWRIFRIALMWLLAFAVPAQGFAAALMFNCGPGHDGKAPVQVASHAGHDHGHAAHKVSNPHHHHSVVSSDAHGDDGATDAIADETVTVQAKAPQKGSCSACASCCTAAALPTAVVSFDATPIHDFIAPLAPPSVAAFLTDGPERPPRPFLA